MKESITLLFLLLRVVVFSQEKINNESVNFFEEEITNPSYIHEIDSKVFSEKRVVVIHLPKTYNKNVQKRYPVLYLLDGERNLKSVIFTAEILASKRKIPEIIIVGLPAGETRDEDYTPNNMLMNSETGNGNANRFQKYLDSELIPYIDSYFRTEPYRILSGHSRGGLFAINHMLSESKLFDAHFAMSPALYLNDYGIIDNLISKIKAKKINSRFLYANAGGIENLGITMSLDKLEAALNTVPANSFNWKAQRFEDDSHGTTAIGGHYHALKKLYRNWDNPWKKGADEIIDPETVKKDHILLSKEFGYSIYPDEYRLNIMGYNYIKVKDFDKAIDAFELNTKYYPDSANAYDSYADGLEAKDSLDLAMEAMDKAVSLLKGKQNSQSELIKKHYETLKKKVQNAKN